MPTTKDYGTEGAANKAIGGVPTVHYFDFGSKGRGQVLRLMLEVSLAGARLVSSCLSASSAQRSSPVFFVPIHLTFSVHAPLLRHLYTSLLGYWCSATDQSLQDAGIAYKDVRYSFEEYPEWKRSQLFDYNPLGTIPVIELNGRILTQSYAILRHWARQLGEYEGKTEEEKYWADAVCDATLDCNSFLGPR